MSVLSRSDKAKKANKETRDIKLFYRAVIGFFISKRKVDITKKDTVLSPVFYDFVIEAKQKRIPIFIFYRTDLTLPYRVPFT